MRKSYSAAFRLGSKDDRRLTPVLEIVLKWLDSPQRGLDLGTDPVDVLTDPHGDRVVKKGHRVETRLYEGRTTKAWALRYSHPDAAADHHRWTTKIGRAHV